MGLARSRECWYNGWAGRDGTARDDPRNLKGTKMQNVTVQETNLEENQDFTRRQIAAEDAIRTLVALHDDGDLDELLENAGLPADVFAKLLMCNMSPVGFNMREKEFWLRVAEYMGPDFIDFLKVRVAFMDKVDGF